MPKKKTAVIDALPTVEPQSPRPRLNKLRISNFRSIGPRPVEIELDDIVVLVGPNNAGKSSILRAYQLVMDHGSNEGKLSLDDFPHGKIDENNLPTIELETVVFDKTAPGEMWVRTDPVTGEMYVREQWKWNEPGAPKKVGWDVAAGQWHQSKGPWGAPNVAQAYRPQAHRVGAFQKPEDQANEVIGLLSKAISDLAKELSKKKTDETEENEPTEYEKLITSIALLRKNIATQAVAAVADVQQSLERMIREVFPGYQVSFDARPEDDVEKTLSIYKPNPVLKMGPQGGFHSTLDRQGSGACRTLMWTALRILAERTNEKNSSSTDRPHLLLMDEPEICLHPDAIREACRVLYDLPKEKNWQVMITTHSPVFIDLSRNNTSIARVERTPDGIVQGTTIFRPQRAKLDEDDLIELKLLNLCDPYVAEFFFGGRTVLVEGDTEYTAFRHILDKVPERYKDVHIVRARGKACISALCKILNQFEKKYAVLHDSDSEFVKSKKTGKLKKNSAWTENEKILAITKDGRASGNIRLLASIPNFEMAFLLEEAESEKPYSALSHLKKDQAAFNAISKLLDSLIDFSQPVPQGVQEWNSIEGLKTACAAFETALKSSNETHT